MKNLTRKWFRMWVVICLVAASLAGVGCGGSTPLSPSTVVPPPPPPPPAVTAVFVSPGVATVPTNGTQPFTATVSPSEANQAVSWGVSGTACSASSCGTIDANGTYTAPATLPDPPTVEVTATSVADSSKSGSATVSLFASTTENSKLNGQYAFQCSGADESGFFAVAGTFTADGTGRITGGTVDISLPNGVFSDQGYDTASTYSINPLDGGQPNVGEMILNTAVGSPTDNFSLRITLALSSLDAETGVASRGRLVVHNDGYGPVTCPGLLAKQDPAAFSNSAIEGGYAFGFAGSGPGGLTVANGRFTASNGSLSAGQIDINRPGVVTENQSFAGSYSVAPDGRGTAALEDPGEWLLEFSFYVVSPDELFCMEGGPRSDSSGGSAMSGLALRQSAAPFADSSLNGPAVFHLTSRDQSGARVMVGQQIFDGMGGVTGSYDSNYGVENGAIFHYYSVDSNGLGRGMIYDDFYPYVFYLVSPGKAFVISQSGPEAGMIEPQTSGPFSDASISGEYVLGNLPSPLDLGLEPLSGVLSSDTPGNLSGWYDKSDFGTSFQGSYAVAPSGRATVAIDPFFPEEPTLNLVFHLISPSRAVGVQVDAGGANPAVYIIEK